MALARSKSGRVIGRSNVTQGSSGTYSRTTTTTSKSSGGGGSTSSGQTTPAVTITATSQSGKESADEIRRIAASEGRSLNTRELAIVGQLEGGQLKPTSGRSAGDQTVKTGYIVRDETGKITQTSPNLSAYQNNAYLRVSGARVRQLTTETPSISYYSDQGVYQTLQKVTPDLRPVYIVKGRRTENAVPRTESDKKIIRGYGLDPESSYVNRYEYMLVGGNRESLIGESSRVQRKSTGFTVTGGENAGDIVTAWREERNPTYGSLVARAEAVEKYAPEYKKYTAALEAESKKQGVSSYSTGRSGPFDKATYQGSVWGKDSSSKQQDSIGTWLEKKEFYLEQQSVNKKLSTAPLYGVGAFAVGATKGAYTIVRHPVQSAKGMFYFTKGAITDIFSPRQGTGTLETIGQELKTRPMSFAGELFGTSLVLGKTMEYAPKLKLRSFTYETKPFTETFTYGPEKITTERTKVTQYRTFAVEWGTKSTPLVYLEEGRPAATTGDVLQARVGIGTPKNIGQGFEPTGRIAVESPTAVRIIRSSNQKYAEEGQAAKFEGVMEVLRSGAARTPTRYRGEFSYETKSLSPEGVRNIVDFYAQENPYYYGSTATLPKIEKDLIMKRRGGEPGGDLDLIVPLDPLTAKERVAASVDVLRPTEFSPRVNPSKQLNVETYSAKEGGYISSVDLHPKMEEVDILGDSGGQMLLGYKFVGQKRPVLIKGLGRTSPLGDEAIAKGGSLLNLEWTTDGKYRFSAKPERQVKDARDFFMIAEQQARNKRMGTDRLSRSVERLEPYYAEELNIKKPSQKVELEAPTTLEFGKVTASDFFRGVSGTKVDTVVAKSRGLSSGRLYGFASVKLSAQSRVVSGAPSVSRPDSYASRTYTQLPSVGVPSKVPYSPSRFSSSPGIPYAKSTYSVPKYSAYSGYASSTGYRYSYTRYEKTIVPGKQFSLYFPSGPGLKKQKRAKFAPKYTASLVAVFTGVTARKPSKGSVMGGLDIRPIIGR